MARALLDVLRSVAGLLVGLVLVFSGYRLARSLAALAGFLAGFVAGLILGLPLGPGALVVGLVAGALLAVVFVVAFRLAGGVLGGVGAWVLAGAIGWPVWGMVLAAVAGAVVGLAAHRATIAGATSLLGAWLAVRSGMELLADASVDVPGAPRTALLVGTLVLAVIGLLSQWPSLRDGSA